MKNHPKDSESLFLIGGLGAALIIATFLSPFASNHPDGLDRVSQDLNFHHLAEKEPPAKKLPFAYLFNEYALKLAPSSIATPLAGLCGTLVTFGLAYGVGKIVLRNPKKDE